MQIDQYIATDDVFSSISSGICYDLNFCVYSFSFKSKKKKVSYSENF
jgi:hypothetical protein